MEFFADIFSKLRYQKAVEAKQQRIGVRCNEKDSGLSGVLGAGKRQVQVIVQNIYDFIINPY